MPYTDYAGVRFQFEPSSLEQILGTIGDVLEHLPMAICIYDHLGRIVRYNQAAVEIWGRVPEPNTTHQKSVAECKFYGTGGRLLPYGEMPLVTALESGREVREQEYTVVRPDGRRVTTIVNINPLRDAGGRIVGTINCIRDVTERKLIDEAFRQSQEHLREQEQRLAATYEHAAIGIAEIDGEGRFLRVNEAICNITGQSRQALLSGRLFDRTHPEDKEADRDSFLRQVRGEVDGYSIEKRYIRQDGEVRWIAVKSTSVRDAENRFLYGVRVVQDVTERRQAEQSQQLLIDELNHRTKNTLAIVQSLFWQTARDKGASKELPGRTCALARARQPHRDDRRSRRPQAEGGPHAGHGLPQGAVFGGIGRMILASTKTEPKPRRAGATTRGPPLSRHSISRRGGAPGTDPTLRQRMLIFPELTARRSPSRRKASAARWSCRARCSPDPIHARAAVQPARPVPSSR